MKPLSRDHLLTECTYNSTGRRTVTRGGFSSRDEMCTAFLHYYPAARLAHCASRLAPWKLPKSFESASRPLRDDAGKLRRQALRRERLPTPPPR